MVVLFSLGFGESRRGRPLHGHCEGTNSVEKAMANEIEELTPIYDEIAEAFRHKDLEAIAKYISSDWTGAHGENKVTRDQLLENVASQFKDFNDISWPRTLSNPRFDGDNVTVRAAGTYRAMKADSGEPFEMELANDDSWRKGQDGWQSVFSTGLEE